MVVARREATPLLAVSLLEDFSILVDEGLANDLDFLADERGVSDPRWRHALGVGGDCRGHDEHGADECSHGRIIDPERETRKREYTEIVRSMSELGSHAILPDMRAAPG